MSQDLYYILAEGPGVAREIKEKIEIFLPITTPGHT